MSLARCAIAASNRAYPYTHKSAGQLPAKAGAHQLKGPAILFSIALSLPVTAVACPIGMQYDGYGCSPPYQYSMDDWIREKNEYLDSLGPKNSSPAVYMSTEEVAELKKLQGEKEQRDAAIAKEIAQGVWYFASSATPKGKLCVATFAKLTQADNGKSGGVVSILGFQQPKPDAWLIFYGSGLPTPQNVKKIKLTLQQDYEPAQTVQVFNYRYERQIGAIAFAVPGLAAALEGMRDKQRFALSIDGETVLALEWTDAAPIIQQLQQCAQ
jgi:hypothetical protein